MTFILERLVLAALALIGASAVFMARAYGDGTGHGGNLLPMLSGSLVCVFAVFALFRSPADAKQNADSSALRPWIVLLGTALFLWLMPIIGYPIGAPLWVAGVMMLLGARHPASILATSAGLSLVAYLLLAKLAFAPPPMGPFGG